MYQAVMIYSTEGDLLGFGIKDDAALKLQSTNIWSEDEQPALGEQLTRLNKNTQLTANWPSPHDAEVVALLQDPEFFPIEMHIAEVVDDERSHYVYTQEEELDIAGNPTGEMVDGELDTEASVIAMKKMEVPVRPSDAMMRIKAACVQVATQRTAV